MSAMSLEMATAAQFRRFTREEYEDLVEKGFFNQY